MTSIGRRLVDRSIGLPQRRQVIDMGDVGGVWTGPSGGGGWVPFAPIGARPPPTRLHSPITAIRSRRNRTPRTMPKIGTPPTSVDQNAVPDPPTWTVWNALAPVLNSFAKTRRPPPPVPCGIRRERSAAAPVVIAETDVEAIERDQRNWLGSDAGPRAVKVSRAGIVSPAAYDDRSKSNLGSTPHYAV